MHPQKGTHWVVYINGKILDSFVCAPPQNLSKFIANRIGHCLYSEYKIQGLTCHRDSFCEAYRLYIFYLTKVVGIFFESGVLKL